MIPANFQSVNYEHSHFMVFLLWNSFCGAFVVNQMSLWVLMRWKDYNLFKIWLTARKEWTCTCQMYNLTVSSYFGWIWNRVVHILLTLTLTMTKTRNRECSISRKYAISSNNNEICRSSFDRDLKWVICRNVP